MKPQPQQPQAFRPGQAAPAVQPQPQQARVVQVAQVPRTVPALTIYPNGFINLNLEATLLLCPLGKGLDFQPPPKPRSGRTPGLWQILPGQTMPFLARRDRGNLRCWAGGLCRPAAGRYALTPIAGVSGRYGLLPV